MNSNKLILGLLLIVLSVFPVLARDAGPVSPGYSGSFLDDTGSYNRLHDVGELWMTITSNCTFGNDGPDDRASLIDPCTGEWSPQGEFPGGSSVQYLFEAGLWVGALIEEDGYYHPRVSTAVEGWFSRMGADIEFWSEGGISERTTYANTYNCLGDYISNPEALTEQEFISVAYDTFMTTPDGATIGHPQDGPHVPLGLEVKQHTYAMASEEYSNIIFLEYTIKNVGVNILRNLYVGLYYDGDVGIYDEYYYLDHFTDDITGFISEDNGETLNIAYIADNDGRRTGVDSGNNFTVPDVVGVKLFNENDVLYTSFNWWVSNGDPDYDFGPSWDDDGSVDSWTDTLGTPISDAQKYFLMSNREFDYDQVRTADSDWITEHPQVVEGNNGNPETHMWKQAELANIDDIANGFDTRFLISWGPVGIFDFVDEFGNMIYRLNPGEETSFTIAVVAAQDFHDADNPQDTYPTMDPSKYDISDLITQSRKVDYLYSNLPALLPPPENDNVNVYSGFTGVVINWDGIEESDQEIFTNIYRNGADTTLNTTPIISNFFVDTLAVFGQEYTYRLQRVKNDTILSRLTDEIHITFGAPEEVLNLVAETGPGVVNLTWDQSEQRRIEGYNILRADQLEDSTYSEYQIIASVNSTSYSDYAMTVGEHHKYKVQAYRHNLPGAYSNEEIVCPYSFSKDLLILSLNSPDSPFLEWDCDEVNGFYFSAFDDFIQDIDTMSVSESDSLSFDELTDYKVIWLNSESDFFYTWTYEGIEDLIEYINVGGRLIVSGVMHYHLLGLSEIKDYFGISDYSSEGTPHPDTNDIFFYSSISASSGYPDMTLDVASLNYPVFGNRIGFSSIYTPVEDAEVIYTYASSSGESPFEGEPIGLIFNGNYEGIEYSNAILGFSLYAMEGDDKADVARNIYTAVLNEPDETEHFSASPGLADDKDFHVYPNPFNAISTLEFHLLENKPVEMKMFNVLGQVVFQTSQRNYQPGSHKLTIDGSKLSTGLYFVQMTIGQKQSIQKLLLVK